MKPSVYIIRETPCFPNAFKIVPVALPGECWQESNAWTEYFPTPYHARKEIMRRGAKERLTN